MDFYIEARDATDAYWNAVNAVMPASLELSSTFLSKISKLRDAYGNTLNEYNRLLELQRLRNGMNTKKKQCNLSEDSNDSDLVHVNVGGEIITVFRGSMTQIDGTLLADMFDDMHNLNIQRDSSNRMFLDVNPVAFRSIVKYMDNLLSLSDNDPLPDPPFLKDDSSDGSFLNELWVVLGLNVVTEMFHGSKNKEMKQASKIKEPWEELNFEEFPSGLRKAAHLEQSMLSKARQLVIDLREKFERGREFLKYFTAHQSKSDEVVDLFIDGKKMSTRLSTLGLNFESESKISSLESQSDQTNEFSIFSSLHSEMIARQAKKRTKVSSTSGKDSKYICRVEHHSLNITDLKHLDSIRPGLLDVFTNTVGECYEQNHNQPILLINNAYCFVNVLDQLRLQSMYNFHNTDAKATDEHHYDSYYKRFIGFCVPNNFVRYQLLSEKEPKVIQNDRFMSFIEVGDDQDSSSLLKASNQAGEKVDKDILESSKDIDGGGGNKAHVDMDCDLHCEEDCTKISNSIGHDKDKCNEKRDNKGSSEAKDDCNGESGDIDLNDGMESMDSSADDVSEFENISAVSAGSKSNNGNDEKSLIDLLSDTDDDDLRDDIESISKSDCEKSADSKNSAGSNKSSAHSKNSTGSNKSSTHSKNSTGSHESSLHSKESTNSNESSADESMSGQFECLVETLV